jgi:hypothetical protein
VAAHEKGGKRHPRRRQRPPFRSAIGKTGVLTDKPVNRVDAYRGTSWMAQPQMVGMPSFAGLSRSRATGSAVARANGAPIDAAARRRGHRMMGWMASVCSVLNRDRLGAGRAVPSAKLSDREGSPVTSSPVVDYLYKGIKGIPLAGKFVLAAADALRPPAVWVQDPDDRAAQRRGRRECLGGPVHFVMRDYVGHHRSFRHGRKPFK